MKFLKQGLLAIAITSIIGTLTYTVVSRYVTYKAEQNLQSIMLSHRSFHNYIQQVMHPTYHKARDAGKIAEDFYAPEILSSSYIIRVMHGFFNMERVKEKLPEVYYKLAANNPRNPVNKADEKETSIIKLFNEHRELKEYSEIAKINGKNHLVYAKPFLENTSACILCHGIRRSAPLGLQNIYSGQGGFNEKVGDIRAIESIRLPLNDEFIATFVATTVSLSAAVILLLLYFFNASLRLRVAQKTAELTREIEERRKAEEALTLTRISVDSATDAIFWIKPDGHFEDVNEAACRNLGYSREELLQMTVVDVDPATTNEVWRKNFSDLRTYGSLRFESSHRTKDGHLFPVEIVANYVKHNNEERNCAFVRDISERKQMENALLQSEERFRSIVESSPLAMYFYRLEQNGDLILTGANPAADKIIGSPHKDLINMRIEDAFPALADTNIPEMYRNVARGTLEHQSFEITYKNERVDGSYQVHVYRTGVDAIAVEFLDITAQKLAEEERINLEKQLLHAQKLESLGVLAGGIAHDFNNLLTSIVGNTDLALLRLNPESPARNNLQQIEQAAARAADLAKQMLAYSGKGKFVIEPIDLNRLVEEMTHMLEVSISKKAVLRFNYAHPLPLVEGDATQLRQVIMNLVINASEAIGDKSGFIAVSTGCVQCDRRYLNSAWLNEKIPEGLYVWVEIADTGCGMNKETIAKIFDPFFTTKFTGRGLGMAAVLGIIRGHNGAIKVYSEAGKGTTFRFLLPAGDKPKELFNGDVDTNLEWKGSGTVLLVDDEETVIGIGSAMLKELGYDVLTAMDGREGLEIYKQNEGRITCVVLDLTMPHLDGEETFKELRQINPEVQVIMSSGYNEQEVTQKFVGKGLAGFIQKPYNFSTLKNVLSKLASLP